MSFETICQLPLPDATRLPFRQSLAVTQKAVIHICHGLAEHSARYARFALALNRAGYHVYAQDHRGHGVNIGAHAPKGMFAPRDGYKLVISDVLALNRHIHETHPSLPVIIFGHSMGGLIAINYALAHSETINAAAIWNANFGDPMQNRLALALLYAERMLKGSDVPSSILPRLTFRAWGDAIANSRTSFDWLSHDATEVDAYIADPLCGFDASVALWIDIFHMMKNGATNSGFAGIRKKLPFNLVGGADDPATDKAAAIRKLADRIRGMGFDNLHCTVYAATRHEGLNELNRDEVTQNFLDWLDEVLPSVVISS
ncbi:alpha/beta hydrolase [Falsochrobactrum sp. TDYN1]|uniref:Alpha/beta hydrolase n=1 Tax=Falsochrobactrum tianjinense TaxID=2706015 RepID=A0A949UV55_9HYPH|nr:alpha/beta hydrolase [Falsochrobactrum sp. TDYN1]MBV2143956.1 alpha/beta hydrolase [Falsochrobactrum sp. TDYN1]